MLNAHDELGANSSTYPIITLNQLEHGWSSSVALCWFCSSNDIYWLANIYYIFIGSYKQIYVGLSHQYQYTA